MPWYWIVLLICLVIGPFDALYVYIRSQRRREELKRKHGEEEDGTRDKSSSSTKPE